MSSQADLFSVGAEGVRLAVTHGADAPPEIHQAATAPDAAADAAAARLLERGYGGDGVVLAIPSAWALAAPVSAEGLPKKGQRQAILYRLEEKLPVSAEEVVADHLPTADGFL